MTPPITRRSMLQGFAVAGITAAVPLSRAAAQDATPASDVSPAATPVIGETIAPEDLLDALLRAEITSDLFPEDPAVLATDVWEDTGDSDLEGAIGGVLVVDTTVEDENDALIGVYIVEPSAEIAAATFSSYETDGSWQVPSTVFGKPAVFSQYGDGVSQIAIVEGNVIVSAVAGRSILDAEITDFRETDAIALARVAGLLDHLRLVTDDPS